MVTLRISSLWCWATKLNERTIKTSLICLSFFFFFLLINYLSTGCVSKNLLIAITQQMFVVNVFQAVNCWQTVFCQWSFEYLLFLFIFAIWIVLTAYTGDLFSPWLNIVVCRTQFPHWLIQVSFSVKILLTTFMIAVLSKLKKVGWSSHKSEFKSKHI